MKIDQKCHITIAIIPRPHNWIATNSSVSKRPFLLSKMTAGAELVHTSEAIFMAELTVAASSAH